MENLTRFKTEKNARFSYVKLVAKGKFGKYEASILIPKSDKKSYQRLLAAVEAAKAEAKDKKWGGKIPTKFKNPAINDGDEKLNKDGDPDEVYAGHWYLTAKAADPVYTCNSKNERIDPKEIYSGCYGIASVNFYGYDFEGSKGIGVELRGIQFISDGEPLGAGGGNVANDFEEFDDEI
jgi:hypothetical protein